MYDQNGSLRFSSKPEVIASNMSQASPSSFNPRRARLYRVGIFAASLLISLTAVEAGLRIIEKKRLGDRAVEQKLVPDPELGNRLAPGTPGHDTNGYRNDSVPAQADIVAVGDSQTWGVNADRQSTWPQQLAKLSGHSVYNMSLGGYGPVQYWVLTQRAQKMSPRLVVVGLYLGNDLYDTYRLAYTNDNYKELRAPNAAPDLSRDTVGPQADFYWNEEKDFHNRFGRTSFWGLSYWTREHLAIGRLLNAAGLWPGATDVDYEIDKAWAKAYPQDGAVYEQGNARTVFTISYRLTG